MSAQHTPGPWLVVTYRTPRGPRMRVQRQNGKAIEVRKSASGKPSTFCTYDAARRVARALNEDAANEAYLKAKYAGLPPLPNYTFGQIIAKATGSAA